MTVLQIIQEVQRRLRLPVSQSLTDAHSQLLLSFINTVQRDFMQEDVVWDECKVYDSFNTVAGLATYTLTISGAEIDAIRHLQIENYAPIGKFSDDDFREYKRSNTGQGQPLVFRIYSRSGGDIIIELCPAPDKAYSVSCELLKKPPRLTGQNETPLLDSDTVIAGVLMLASGEQEGKEPDSFQAKLSLQGDTQGESNWGDAEAV